MSLEAAANIAARSTDLLALDEALMDLAAESPRKAQVIELRFFGGLSHQETAAFLAVSEDTLRRDWRLARMMLLRAMDKKRPNAG